VTTPEVHICGPGLDSPLPRYVYAFWLVISLQSRHNFTHNTNYRIPPLAVEVISLILVAYKAVLHYQGNTPREWAGSRLMDSIVRYSVFYFSVYVAFQSVS